MLRATRRQTYKNGGFQPTYEEKLEMYIEYCGKELWSEGVERKATEKADETLEKCVKLTAASISEIERP